LAPHPEIEALYHRVEREKKGDQSADRLVGMRVQLRYEGLTIPADTAREMLSLLDGEFTRISTELGCASGERLVAVAQSPQAYRRSTDAAEWSGGQFDGKIRVPVFDARTVDATLRRTLAHEIAHACLSMLGRWPAWLHEGVAQRVSGDVVDAGVRAQLRELGSRGRLPKLSQLGQDWSGMSRQSATLAYGLSLMAVEVFLSDYGALGLRNLLHNPDRLATVTADLERRLPR
jgi:hypothetical protein